MFHTCVRIFDVTGTVEIFLRTKQGLSPSVHVLLHAEMEYTAAGTRSYETLSEVTKMAVAADVYTLLQGLEAGAAYLCRPQERKENASSCSREVKDCERY